MAEELTDDLAPTEASPQPPPAPPPVTGRPAPDGRPVGRRRRSRGWVLLVLLPILGAVLLGGAALAYNRVTPPSYTADALIAVLPTVPATGVSLPITGVWVEVGSSEALLRQSADDLGVRESQLASAVTVTQPSSNAPVVQVSATTGNPQLSAAWANSVASRLVSQARDNPVPGYGLQTVASAIPPLSATQPVTPLIIGVATALGALIGLVLAQTIVGLVRRRRRRRVAGG